MIKKRIPQYPPLVTFKHKKRRNYSTPYIRFLTQKILICEFLDLSHRHTHAFEMLQSACRYLKHCPILLLHTQSTALQQYCVCRPQCFQRFLLRTAIRVGTNP